MDVFEVEEFLEFCADFGLGKDFVGRRRGRVVAADPSRMGERDMGE